MDLFDSHAHLTEDSLFNEIDAVIARAEEANVKKICNICTDEVTLQRGLHLHKQYPWIYNVGGVHPHDAEKGDELFPIFCEAAKQGSFVAIGETGLDYFYENSSRKKQQEMLERHFAFALEIGLPVVIHCREAFDDFFAIADSCYKNENLLLHCFTGTEKEAFAVFDRGWMLSFSGILTFKKSIGLREIARKAPNDRILIETDAPYLAPQSRRGKRNESSFVGETLEMLARVKGVTPEQMASQTMENASAFFQLNS